MNISNIEQISSLVDTVFMIFLRCLDDKEFIYRLRWPKSRTLGPQNGVPKLGARLLPQSDYNR